MNFGGRLRLRGLLPACGVGIALVLSEFVSRWELLPSRDFPPVTLIARALWRECQTPELAISVLRTLQGWASGLCLAIVFGVLVGAFVGANDRIYRSLRLIIEFLRPIPPVALLPVAVLSFGAGMLTKSVLVALATFWPIMLQTMYGVQNIDPLARDTLRSYGVSPSHRARFLVLPSLAPYLVTGIRVASSIALIVSVSTELVIGAPGLGATINAAQNSGEVPVQYAYIVVAGVLGWLLSAGFRYAEHRIIYWRETEVSISV